MRWTASVVVPTLIVGLTCAASASAAPSAVTVDPVPELVSSRVTTVPVKGHWDNQEYEPLRSWESVYVATFVQDAAVRPSCDTTISAQIASNAGLAGLGATERTTGWVLSAFGGPPGDVAHPDGSVEGDIALVSSPFSIRPGVRRVVFCSYLSIRGDDKAYGERAADVTPSSCRPTTRRVRRGTKLKVRCNISGTVTVRLRKGGRSVRRAFSASRTDGSGRMTTRGLARGRWRATFAIGAVPMGSARFTVR